MKIIEIKKIEDCFDGSTVYGYLFDESWTRDRILGLRTMGNVDYFPDFPRPFFRLRGKNGMQVKGVEGEKNCRAIFPKSTKDAIKKLFEDYFTCAPAGG